MQLRHPGQFLPGYEPIVAMQDSDMLMDFGILTLGANECHESPAGLERAFLLMRGTVRLSWTEPGIDGAKPAPHSAQAVRESLFDESPAVLHLSPGAIASIFAGEDGAEFAVTATVNPGTFASRFFTPEECRSEERGKGTMRETSTRIVRTVFDDSNAPDSMLVLGEVVGAPGKWSSYPPHHHPQPEIYHYRFLPRHGFGLTAIGDRAYVLQHNDTILIRDTEDHPQVTAPGYAMWYLWVIRHLDDNRYSTPEFTSQHRWVAESGAPIWIPPSER